MTFWFERAPRGSQMRIGQKRTYVGMAAMTAASFLLAAQAQAHRFGGPNDPCERRIGASLIHITLYQPQFDPDAEYCNEVPREGKTVLVVDILGDELRRVPMGLEMIATGNSRDSQTILSVAPKVYKRGVADTEVLLTEGNDYVARVILEDGAGGSPQALSFPIRVKAWYTALIFPALIVLALAVLVALSIIRYFYTSSRSEESALEPLDEVGKTVLGR